MMFLPFRPGRLSAAKSRVECPPTQLGIYIALHKKSTSIFAPQYSLDRGELAG
jgi:hypothetical protein